MVIGYAKTKHIPSINFGLIFFCFLRSLNSMQIRCKFGQLGPGKGQFNSPHGFCLGLEEEIIVADTNNHRIQVLGRL